MRLDPPPRPVAYEPDSIPPPPRDSLLMRVNRRRGQILTFMVSVAAIASFGSVVWWAHNQDVKAGGKGLEPLVVQAPTTPSRVKPENAGGLVPPNQDKEVYNRIAPGRGADPAREAAAGLDQSQAAGQRPADAGRAQGRRRSTPPRRRRRCSPPRRPRPRAAARRRHRPAPRRRRPPTTPATTDVKPGTTETGPSIASLIDNMSGPTGGWRIQVASVKSEDVAKSTWARLQSAHGDVLANLAHAAGARRSRRQGRVVSRPGGPARREAGPQRLRHAEEPQDRLRRRAPGAVEHL